MGIEYNELKVLIADPIKLAEKIWSKKGLLINNCVEQVETKLVAESWYEADKEKINNISLKLKQIKETLLKLNKFSQKY